MGDESLGSTPRSSHHPPPMGIDRALLHGDADGAGVDGRDTSQPADPFEETASVWGFGETGQSTTSTQSETLQQSARTMFGDTLTLGGGGGDGGLSGLLQQLALDSFSID